MCVEQPTAETRVAARSTGRRVVRRCIVVLVFNFRMTIYVGDVFVLSTVGCTVFLTNDFLYIPKASVGNKRTG